MDKICLIVTSSEKFSIINNFFTSITKQNKEIEIDISFVNQNKLHFPGFDFKENINFKIIEVNHIIPLSKARNIAISNMNLLDYDLVAFPDDDCWYDSKLLNLIFQYFKDNIDYDVVCTNVIDPSNNKTYGGRPKGIKIPVTEKNIFEYPISVGIFLKINENMVKNIYFDESLGAGTEIGSGEETELIYRLIKNKEKCIYIGDFFVYHPVIDSNYTNEDILKYYKYGIGFGYLARRMVNNKDLTVLIYFLYIILRSFAGLIINMNKKTNRRVYYSRLKGVFTGFFRAN